MIGALAIIAILAALIVPKIFEAINSARLNHAVISCHTMKTAAVEHFAKFGSFASSNGVPVTVPGGGLIGYDSIFLAEALIDKRFVTKISANSFIRLVTVSFLDRNSDPGDFNGAYDLDGDGNNDIVNAQYLVEAVLKDVTEADAQDLNDRFDGPQLAANPGGNDFKGRLTYHHATGQQTVVDVHIYLTHR